MQQQNGDEITPLTCDPELKRKWNRFLALERQLRNAKDRLKERQNELNRLRGELGIDPAL